jgi:monoamine oxidase
VIIVSAGLAGLSAAQAIVAAGKSVLVLEAQDRVGGRIWTEPVPGYPNAWIDMGGQWVGYNPNAPVPGPGPGQTYVEALINQQGLTVFPTWMAGNNQLFYNGGSATYSGENFPDSLLGPGSIEDFTAALLLLAAMSTTVDVNNPALTPNAEEWDSQTFLTWMNANLTTAGGAFLMGLTVAGYIGTAAKDFSLLHFLFYIAAGGGYKSLHTYGLQYRVMGGTQQIATTLATQLGNNVILNTRVEEIDQTGSTGVTVVTDNGTYQGQQVIVRFRRPWRVECSTIRK